ncbi:MAG: COX15/CtaA family protein [Deltaproteobacteria bacterium]
MLGIITVSVFFAILVWGNLVSGLGVGLACPDWPLCHGQVIPPFEFGILMEWTHRNLALLGSILLLALAYKRIRAYAGAAKLIPVAALFLLIFQIVLGGMVVLLELPVDITTVHFGNAIVIFGLILYMAFFDGTRQKPAFSVSKQSGIFFVFSLAVFIQAILGAYVRHSDSGLACPDFPKCLGFWIPPELSGTVLTHFSHRTLGYLIFIFSVLLYVLSYSNSRLAAKRSKIAAIIALIIFQIILGAGVVASKLHYSAVAIHLAVALLILSTALYAWFQNMNETRV